MKPAILLVALALVSCQSFGRLFISPDDLDALDSWAGRSIREFARLNTLGAWDKSDTLENGHNVFVQVVVVAYSGPMRTTGYIDTTGNFSATTYQEGGISTSKTFFEVDSAGAIIRWWRTGNYVYELFVRSYRDYQRQSDDMLRFSADPLRRFFEQ